MDRYVCKFGTSQTINNSVIISQENFLDIPKNKDRSDKTDYDRMKKENFCSFSVGLELTTSARNFSKSHGLYIEGEVGIFSSPRNYT